jgi:phosphoglycolate phosphatase
VSESEAPFVVVFDLDGTLAATAGDILAAINQLMVAEGLPTFAPEKAFELVSLGNGARALIDAAFRNNGRFLDDSELDTQMANYLANYLAAVCVHSDLYPDCQTMLELLQERGYRLAVCTNKPQAHSEQLLARLGIREHFAAVAGVDTYAFHKPDPRHLLQVIRDAGGTARRAVMVGDTKVDIRTARAADVPIIGLGHGYSDIPIAQLGPDVTLDDFAGLADAIDSIRDQLLVSYV